MLIRDRDKEDMGMLKGNKDTAVVDIWTVNGTVNGDVEDKTLELSKDLEYWMTNLPDELRKIAIIYLAIPGSHDSFTYSIDSNSKISPDAEPILQYLAVFGKITQSIMAPWARTQNNSATEQLLAGIRYFDLRISTRENDDKLYFVHGQFADYIVPVFNEVKIYLDNHPHEVVILDCQHFYAFSEANHRDLIDTLLATFGDKLLPYTQYMEHLNLNYLTRDYQYQVVVVYRHNLARRDQTLLWPAACFATPWPDTMNPDTLIRKLDANLEKRRPTYAYVSQFVLTPTTSTVLTHLCSSLEQKCAVLLDKRKSLWISRQRPGKSGVNIIIADFIDLSSYEFCKAVISLNLKLMGHPIGKVKSLSPVSLPPVDG